MFSLAAMGDACAFDTTYAGTLVIVFLYSLGGRGGQVTVPDINWQVQEIEELYPDS